MLIYNIKQQANLPTGTYANSGASGSADGTIGVYIYFKQDGTWRVQNINGLAGSTIVASGTWESRAPSTPINYEINFVVNSVSKTGVSTANGDDGYTRYGINGGSVITDTPTVGYDTGWIPFTQEHYWAVTSTNEFGPSVVCNINFTVNIRDSAPTFNTISSIITIQSTGT